MGLCIACMQEEAEYTVVAPGGTFNYCHYCGHWRTPEEYMVPFNGTVVILEEFDG